MSDIKIVVTDEQIYDAVRAVVEEEMPDAVRGAVRAQADTVIRQMVRERLAPLVEEVLTSDEVVTTHSGGFKFTLNDLVKRTVRSYLDERVYLYSKDKDLPSERFVGTSSSHGPSRLQAFLGYVVERFCDEHLADKLAPVVAEFIEQKGGIEQVAREQMAALLKKRFSL